MYSSTTPKGGVDYPTTWGQFIDWFHYEDAFRTYLEKLRWVNGFSYPKCGVVGLVVLVVLVVGDAGRSSRRRLVCGSSRHQTTGTIFDKTRTELRVWLAGICRITNHCQVSTELQLCFMVGFWERAMVRCNRSN